jgi:FtsZ-binding cell division protein ZapB
MSDFIEDHAKAVAFSLAALFVTACVASGLWIHSLRATIAATNAALTEGTEKASHLEFQEEHNRQEMEALRTENQFLSEQVTILRRTANHLSTALARITTVLNEASAGSASSSSYRPDLAKAVTDLEKESDDMSRAIQSIDAGRPSLREPAAQAAAEGPSGADRRAPSPAAAWIALAVIALGLLAFAVFLYRRFQDLQGREQRLRQERERLKRPLIRNSVPGS